MNFLGLLGMGLGNRKALGVFLASPSGHHKRMIFKMGRTLGGHTVGVLLCPLLLDSNNPQGLISVVLA